MSTFDEKNQNSINRLLKMIMISLIIVVILCIVSAIILMTVKPTNTALNNITKMLVIVDNSKYIL
ncbi:hypothetical protein J7S27_00035 [Carnobacteriaceae bacterium zg-C25]|nr:hypothetical protein J7S27_00035 [Carnobacteriaceae bacterium zg-C25]